MRKLNYETLVRTNPRAVAVPVAVPVAVSVAVPVAVPVAVSVSVPVAVPVAISVAIPATPCNFFSPKSHNLTFSWTPTRSRRI